MSAQPFPHLFSPFQLGSVTLPNRLVMAPMSTNLGSEDGYVTPRQVAFYRARAEGGIGMIIVEICCVHRETGKSEHRQLSLELPEQVDGHQRLVEAISGAGSVPCLQIQHGGPGVVRALVKDHVAVGPSDAFSRRDPSKQMTRALSNDEIEHLIDCFGRTAELGLRAGYEVFELHGAHGYLLTAFMSPFTNKRDDAWGGDEDRRLAFPIRVIQRVKEVIGDRPLSYRFSADEFTPGGLTIDDMERICQKLVAAGTDALHASIGLGGTSFDKVIEPMSTAEGWRIPYARRIREATGVPVTTVGQIRWPEMADRAIADGSADLVALGRPLLADPAWANKAKRGDVGAIRPCTSCNYCVIMGSDPHGAVGCAENPLTGHELDGPLSAGVHRGRRAVVVGGGPGGMAAALMLDQAGYKTELVEKRDSLGGGLIASAAPPHKEKLLWYRDYLERRLGESGVAVKLGHAADASILDGEKPAVVIVAAGGTPNALPIAGAETSPAVGDAYEILMGNDAIVPPPGALPLAVYGGGETGCELAEWLAERGHDVVLITRSAAKSLARSAEMIYRGVLLGRLMTSKRIRVMENTTIASVADDGTLSLVARDGTTSELKTGRLLIAQGQSPDQSLTDALAAAGVHYALIGNARQGGRIGDAVHDAYRAVRSLCAAGSHMEALAC